MLECRIGFLPLLRSRRLVQQHPIPACRMNATNANPVETHMKTNMRVPTYALMLRDACAVAAYLKTKLITEAMTLPTRIIRKVRKEIRDIGRAHHREKMAMGERKTMMKETMVPARKKANMMLEQILRIPRI